MRIDLTTGGRRASTPNALPTEADDPALAAERSVLAAMLLDASAVARARTGLDSTAFHRTAHSLMFSAFLALADRGEPVDLVTACAELRKRGDLEAVGGAAYLAGLFDSATTSANVEHHAAIVAEAAHKRALKHALLGALERTEDGATSVADLCAHLESSMRDLPASQSAGRFADASIDAASFGGLALSAPEPLLKHGRHNLLCAGDGALLFGKAGIGKTALALDLCVSVALGEPWFGISTPEGGVPVGLLELELPEDALQQRLQVVAGDRLATLDTLHILCRPALVGLVDLDTEQDRAALRSWVKRNGLKLVVVDALVRAHGGDEGDEGLKPLLLWFDALGRELGCSFLLLHHERKGDAQKGREQDPLDAARGHSMLTTYPMLCMRVYRHGPVRALGFPKVTRGPEPEPIYFRLGDGGLPEPCTAPEAASRAKGKDNRARMLSALCAACDGQSGVPAEALEAATGFARSTVREHLTRLVEAGDAVRIGSGHGVTYRPSVQASEQTALGLTQVAVAATGCNDSSGVSLSPSILVSPRVQESAPKGGGTRSDSPDSPPPDGERALDPTPGCSDAHVTADHDELGADLLAALEPADWEPSGGRDA